MSNALAIVKDELRRHLRYEPASGEFTWITNRHNTMRAGSAAGSPTRLGYVSIVFRRKRYYAHRLAWLFEHGIWPAGSIDHIDGNKSNNAIANLRDVCHEVNMQNVHHASANNTSGYRGVSLKRGRWRASISVGGKQVALGCFDTREEAHAAYVSAKKTHHKGSAA